MAVPLHKRAKRAIRSLLLRASVRLLSFLPLMPALLLGRAVGYLAWFVSPQNRRLMLQHLAMAFPERAEAERRAIARASLVHLGELVAETIAMRGRVRPIEGYVSIAEGGEETVRRAMERGRGLIYAAGHIGNWELLACRLALLTRPAAVIAKRNSDDWLNRTIEQLRTRWGLKTLWREDAATGREIVRLLRKGGGLGILIDQDTRVQGVFVPFFGSLAFTPRAVGDLALRFGATVVGVASHRRGDRVGAGHELEIAELSYDPNPSDREREVERLTAAAVAFQEAAIRRHPNEWVWMHRRWRTRPGMEQEAARMPKSRELSSI